MFFLFIICKSENLDISKHLFKTFIISDEKNKPNG